MDQNLWQMCCYVVCFGNASRTISEQYCADIPMMIDTLRKSVASSAATARKMGKMLHKARQKAAAERRGQTIHITPQA